MDAVDGWLATGVVECLFDEVLMDVRFRLADLRSSLIWQSMAELMACQGELLGN